MPVQGGTTMRVGAVGFECHREGSGVCVCVWNLQLPPVLKGKTEKSQTWGEKSKQQNLMTVI